MFKVTTEDVFKRAGKMVAEIQDEIKALEIQREEVSPSSLPPSSTVL